MDRNLISSDTSQGDLVALRKESVDRNMIVGFNRIEDLDVALRKESVDRNEEVPTNEEQTEQSLSARRAWIEIPFLSALAVWPGRRSPQGERG